MPDHHSLEETERATQARVGRLAVDFEAARAVSSLYRAANAARSHLTNTVLRPHELTWTGFLVLWLLWLWDSMETRHVAESVGISKATLTGVTKTLMSRGLVDRVPSDVDRRLVELRLSDKGERLMAELYPSFNRAEAQLVQGLPVADVVVLTEALRHIVRVAEEHDPTAV
jgi:MarR family transcriptional regulator, organic hydroperoxide resistance regulator